jgi:hypothetical protein
LRRDLLEQFQPFSANGIFEEFKSRNVAAGAGEAIDVADADRVGNDHKYNRYAAGRQLMYGG